MRRLASRGVPLGPQAEPGSAGEEGRLTMSDATASSAGTKVTVGFGLDDRHTQVCALDDAGDVIEEARLATKPQALDAASLASSACGLCSRRSTWPR